MFADPVLYEKPVPREPTSPARRAQIQAQNRRREYLERHPSYFGSLDHELADPVLYERLVKTFQSQEERTEEGKAKGYGRTLEASLIRGETNLANLSGSGSATPATVVASAFSEAPAEQEPPASHPVDVSSSNGKSSSSSSNPPESASDAKSEAMLIDRPWDQPVTDKQQGLYLWNEFLEFRFVHGRDDDFDYAKVDEEEDLDTLKHKDAEDHWYDDEEPSWVGDGGDMQPKGDDAQRKGETGIQDF